MQPIAHKHKSSLISLPQPTLNFEVSIYCQNVSGMYTKINSIRNGISRSAYDVIVFQETWLKSETDSDEVICGTQFNIVRRDRSDFFNKRSRGGGVIILVNEKHEAYELIGNEKTIVEIVAIRIKLGKTSKYACILNTYMSPYGNKIAMINEIERFVLSSKRTYPQYTRQKLLCTANRFAHYNLFIDMSN